MGWLIFTFLLGAGLLGFVLWLRNKNIAVKWWEWLIGAIGLLALLVAIQHWQGSLTEGYSQAGWIGALVFGLPGLILLAVAWQLVTRRQRAG